MPRGMRDRRMRDMRRSRRDSRRDMARGGRGRDRNYGSDYGDYGYDMEYDMARGGRGGRGGRDSARGRDYGDYGRGDYGRGDYARGGRRSGRDSRDYGYDYDYDYADGLEDEELMEWSKELIEGVEPNMKQHFTKEAFERKAKELGINDDKFEYAELYTTTLMLYDDYKKTLGSGNIDLYIRLAKDWLEDEDSELKGSEKLATYYDEIVCGGE